MSEKLHAYGTRITLRPEPAKTRSAGGLHLPDQAQEKSQRGEVLDAGNDIKGDLKAGDTVLYSKYAGMVAEIDGEDLLVLNEGDVLGVVTTE